MKIRSHNDRAVRVTSVLTSACGSVQLTRYQGTREALVKMRLAEPDWFETGKSGTKRVTDPTLSLEQRYEMKSMARKRRELLHEKLYEKLHEILLSAHKAPKNMI